MTIPVLESVKTIEQQYRTGEEPVLVMCSDKNAYVCKYMRSSNASFKLACELIGSVQHGLSVPSLGSRRIEGVVDVSPSTNGDINFTIKLLRQLLKISLFDF